MRRLWPLQLHRILHRLDSTLLISLGNLRYVRLLVLPLTWFRTYSRRVASRRYRSARNLASSLIFCGVAVEPPAASAVQPVFRIVATLAA